MKSKKKMREKRRKQETRRKGRGDREPNGFFEVVIDGIEVGP